MVQMKTMFLLYFHQMHFH